jgi:ribosome-binding factor A
MLRVGEQVRAAITQVLQATSVRDPLIENTLISVTEVRMSPDLKVATAYVTPLGQHDHEETIMPR